MNQPIIEITGLGKKYRIGAHKEPYLSLRDELAKPFRRLSSVLSNLTTHNSQLTTHNSQSSATHHSQSPTTHNSPLTIHNSQQDFWALRDVSFSVNQGEAVGIIGRNGAGKSTLLKILSQITPPTEGKITCRGRIASLLEVGTGFHPELTGRENIYMNGAILGMRRAEITRKFDEIVAFAEVDQFLDTPVKRYSSGMYVRLAFAVAAHLEPEILIVDEVLAVGDAQFQKKCLGKMQDVAKGGRTVLFVSHNMAAIRQLCASGVLLEHGRVKNQGKIDQVIIEYLGGTSCSRAIVDVSQYRSPLGKNEITIDSVELLNSVGGIFAINWDQPMKLLLTCSVHEHLKSVNIALGCNTIENNPVFTVRNSDLGEEYSEIFPGKISVSVSVDHNLRAGIYRLIIGITSGNTHYYYNPSVAHIEVLDVGATKHYRIRNNGLINCDSKWLLNKTTV